MRLCILCRGVEPLNSVSNVALHHADELSRLGHAVLLISDRLPSCLPRGVTGVSIHPCSFGWLHRLGHLPAALAFSWSAWHRLRGLHRRDPMDALIFHSHPDAALVGWWWSRRCRRPYVMVSHGVIFDRPAGTYDPLLSWLFRLCTRPAFRRAALVVALSPAMADLACRYGANSSSIALIPNGIEPEEIGLQPGAHPVPRALGSPLRLLFVGTHAAVKGLDVLLQACAYLRERQFAFHLTCIGSGPAACVQAYEDWVSEHGLQDHVSFIGVVPRRQLANYYLSHDLLVIPSRSDPLPTVVLEAMVAGCPVLGTAVGGLPYLLHDGEAGSLVDADSPQDLAIEIVELAMSPERMARLAEAARMRALREFSWSAAGKRLLDSLQRHQHSAIASTVDDRPCV